MTSGKNSRETERKVNQLPTEDKILRYLLVESNGGDGISFKIGTLAQVLNLKNSTLSMALRRLNESGLVYWKPYKEVKLTKAGVDYAKELWRHQRMLEYVLVNEIGVEPQKAHEEANELTRPLSCETINAICGKYGHPAKCPCGDPIWIPSTCNCTKE